MRKRLMILGGASLVLLACGKSCRGEDAGPEATADSGAPDAHVALISDAAPAESGIGADGALSRFSLPIAAARDTAQPRTYVAGLVAAESKIELALVDDLGAESFRAEVLRGASWSQDAELRVFAAAHGAWVVWRGPADGGRVQRARFVGDDGHVATDSVDVLPAYCATGDTLHVVQGGELVSRLPDGGVSRTRLADPSAEVSIMCDDGRLLLMSDTEEQGVFLEVPEDGGLRHLSAFNADAEGRTTAIFSSTQRAGVLRVGGTEAVVRELVDGRLARGKSQRVPISEDDDIVVVDAVGDAPMLVTTREAEGACEAGAAAPRVAVSLLAASSTSATSLGDAGLAGVADAAPSAPLTAELAPAACGRERGSFWSGATGADVVVAWVERVRQAGKSVAPIAAVGFARVRADGTVIERGTIELAADGVVDASCDAHDCYAAVLMRPEGHDDSRPESVRVVPLRRAR